MMKKFLVKCTLYLGLVLIALELLVRIFHLYADDPPSFIDEFGVRKRVPGSEGYFVTGNRRQNFSAYSINDFGFNSFREFSPTWNKYEIALIGDSFIEGLHQDVDNSLGKKIERLLPGLEVYEYGCAGSTMAYQMHLVNRYKEKFKKIDRIIFYMKFKNDFDTHVHEVDYESIQMLNTLPFRIRKNCKLWVYGSNYGMTMPIKNIASAIWRGFNFLRGKGDLEVTTPEMEVTSAKNRIENFKKLIATYGLDAKKTVLLLDSRVTHNQFLDFCKENGISYLDFSEAFQKAKDPVTLVYDMHWNDYGRELLAEIIADYLKGEIEH